MRWVALLWIVGTASTFTFLSVFWWALQRRREREALYRHETARRFIERGEAEQAIAWLREDEAAAEVRRREGLKLSALVWIATGTGVLLGLPKLQKEEAILGWVPLLIGAALLVYLFFFAEKNFMKKIVPIFLLLLCRAPAVPAEEKPALPPQQAQAIEAVVRREKGRLGIPGLSLAIARGGVLVHSRSFGLADVENDVPARPATRFRTASVAKSLTATAVMLLVEKGRLDLDAPIQKYCPAFPEKPWPVTARQLLTHTAGIRHYNRPGESRGTDHFFTVADSLRLFQDDPLLFEPGTKFGYSTFGYNVLGCAVEGASGTTYDAFLASAVLGPAGMTATGPDDHFLVLPGRANGYTALSEEEIRGLPPAVRSQVKPGQLINAPLHDTSMKRSAGGLLSTAEDLARFALAFEAGKLVSPDTVRQMWTVQPTRDGAGIATPWGPLGIGWFVKKSGGLTEIYSSGGQVGGRSSLYVYPESGTALAVMTNLTNAEIVPMEREILHILLPEVPVEP